MILKTVKGWGVWIASFIRPQTIRKSVLINGEEDAGVAVEKTPPCYYSGAVEFTPYPMRYVLIGTQVRNGDPSKVIYRFLDPSTKTEFLLSKELSDLLLHRVSPVFPRANVEE